MSLSTSTSSARRTAWWLLPALLVLALPLYNVSQDYYGVFHQRQDWRGLVPNERYLKYQALQERPGEVESVLFGSSKASNIPFYRNLGSSAYNFAYSEGLPADHLEVLTELVRNQPSLTTVYIAVDDMSYLLDPAGHEGDYLRRQHPDVADIPRLRFLASFLFRRLSNTDYLYFFGDRGIRPSIVYEFETSGRSLCPACDREIEADPEAHREQPFFRFPYNPPDRYGIDRLGEDLRAIRQLLDANTIELVLFLQPSYTNNLRWHNLGMLEELKRELASIAEFHDFLVYEPRLADPANYYDVIHFRPNIGQDIMDVLRGERVPGPGQFGYRVDADSLEQHLGIVRGTLLGELVPLQKYQQDVDYSRWQRAHNFSRSPLPERAASSLLDAQAATIACHVDSLNRRRLIGNALKIGEHELSTLEISGWAEVDSSELQAYLRVQDRDVFSPGLVYRIAGGLRRQDVAKSRGAPLLQSGFRGNLDVARLGRGNYRLSLLIGAPGEWLECNDDIRLVVF